MKREILNKNKKFCANVFTLIFFCLLLILIIRLSYLCLSNKIDGIDLKLLTEKRNTTSETLYALRGGIYDSNGEVLAQTINSYTLLAYLEESRGEGHYVKNKEETAKKLATVLDIEESKILSILKKDAYQVEFGSKARGLTELQKEAIENLGLDGLDFITTNKRYYPNNDFLSYVIGYTKTNDDGTMIGEMGIEKLYNDKMTGTNGSVTYQKDLNGYKFPNSNEIRKEKVDGSDVYLTIDLNVQMSLEKVIKKAMEESNSDWILAVVADAKTGKILGSTSTPSFDPNIKNISNYLNPLVSYTYEPGSVMKTFTYMAAFENNPNFDLNTTFTSGPYKIGDDTIRDWNKVGFGTISYERGYTLSANTGIISIIKNYLSREELKDYFLRLGFGSKTGIELPDEYSGKIAFKYDVEVVNAGFGQGITTTAIQQIKALTSISNNGVLLTPYIVEKVVNPTTGEIEYEGKKQEGERVASIDTVNKIKDLMYKVTHGDSSTTTGSSYYLEGYDLIGKTGTAQIANSKTGRYFVGSHDYITSFAGMYPKEDPKVIIYIAMQRNKVSKVLPETVKTITKDTAKYLEIFEEEPEKNKEVTTYKMGNYLNKNIEEVKNKLNELSASYVLFGNGNKIINQYPKENTLTNTKQKIFLFTNDTDITMPDLTGYSYNNAKVVLDTLGIKYEILSNGYVQNQSVPAGTKVNNDTVVTLN